MQQDQQESYECKIRKVLTIHPEVAANSHADTMDWPVEVSLTPASVRQLTLFSCVHSVSRSLRSNVIAHGGSRSLANTHVDCSRFVRRVPQL